MPIICSFFGHRDTGDAVEPELRTEIEKHITEKNVDTFYLGGYGGFDALSASVLRKMQKTYPHIKIYIILAYMPNKKNEFEKEQFETIYPEGLEFVPKKFAIFQRNHWVVEQSDYLIACVRANYGGAYEALKYAKQKSKQIVNLAKLIDN